MFVPWLAQMHLLSYKMRYLNENESCDVIALSDVRALNFYMNAWERETEKLSWESRVHGQWWMLESPPAALYIWNKTNYNWIQLMYNLNKNSTSEMRLMRINKDVFTCFHFITSWYSTLPHYNTPFSASHGRTKRQRRTGRPPDTILLVICSSLLFFNFLCLTEILEPSLGRILIIEIVKIVSLVNYHEINLSVFFPYLYEHH